ncbi:protease complex subunit PrcB family protein [Halothermothrix orenii]|nr:protease complex subunit PrcB family protein [Halothermothrix orenii]
MYIIFWVLIITIFILGLFAFFQPGSEEGVDKRVVEFTVIEKEVHGEYKEPSYIVKEGEDFFDITISRGEKPTSGYGVEVTRVTREGKNITIWLRFSDPAPEEFVTQVITHPQITIRIKRDALKEVTNPVFIFKNSEGKLLEKSGS